MHWPDDLDAASLKQPDGFSCGATSVLVARLLWESGVAPADPGAEIQHLHRTLTAPQDSSGRAQVPWPRAFGTPPWSVARALSDLTGQEVETDAVRLSADRGYDELVSRVESRPVAAYVGSFLLPRHVVLAYGSTAGGNAVRVFNPATGRRLTVPRGRWIHHELDPLGWSHFWFVV
ncbi:hypothetical protein HNR19_003238 [Nocardioides thalensis]|uniref:Peptidase C39-like domain-containing protein n=1 Tax=Nocardioides thalensis TaxID=1914755 RepID=A0A853C2Y7_9ACTN|nr:hypothetical protein [Nocardioides thalensis]NYJ02540.1 hypothetical protein [Nocardioides thalensis]